MTEIEIRIPRSDGGELNGILYENSNSEVKSPLIIMCHGFTGDKFEWGRFSRTAEVLSENGYDTILFDFSGSGKNERIPILLSDWILNLEDVYAWVKKKGYNSIASIALSLGGLTALLAKLPEIKTIVFWAPAIGIPPYFRILAKFLSPLMRVLKKTPIQRNSLNNEDVSIDYRFLKEIGNIRFNKYLKDFSTPSMIIQGDVDTTVKPKWNISAFSKMPQDNQHQLILVHEADHNFCDNHLEEFIDHSVKWFKKYL